MALDDSASIDDERFYLMLDFLKSFADMMNIEEMRLGVETFADQATVQFNLNDFDSKEDIINAISFMHTKGSTNTAAALQVYVNLSHYAIYSCDIYCYNSCKGKMPI